MAKYRTEGPFYHAAPTRLCAVQDAEGVVRCVWAIGRNRLVELGWRRFVGMMSLVPLTLITSHANGRAQFHGVILSRNTISTSPLKQVKQVTSNPTQLLHDRDRARPSTVGV